jgi:hypothetical protein
VCINVLCGEPIIQDDGIHATEITGVGPPGKVQSSPFLQFSGEL